MDGLTRFEICWTEQQIDLLERSLDRPLLPSQDLGGGWDYGADPTEVDAVRRYWIEHYDWRGALAALNRYPQFLAEVDGETIHVVHIRSKLANARPLLLTHGWPGSIFEFWDIADRLAGAGFDLVIPSLPGFGYSAKPKKPMGPRRVAALWDRLMTEVLGYDRYLAQGGDWGSAVTSQIGLNHADHVVGIHLNMIGIVSTAPAQNEAETAWMAEAKAAMARSSGYFAIQSTKPISLAWLAEGNPLGQAAWIIERFHDWADLRGGTLESVFGYDRLITNLMLYVMPDSFASSMWIYAGYAQDAPLLLTDGQRVEVPTGFLSCPADAINPAPPRSRIALSYNLTHWTELDRGGHFPAMEVPERMIDDIVAWADKVWPA